MNFCEKFVSGKGGFETIREEKLVLKGEGKKQKGEEMGPNIQTPSQICFNSGIYSAVG